MELFDAATGVFGFLSMGELVFFSAIIGDLGQQDNDLGNKALNRGHRASFSGI